MYDRGLSEDQRMMRQSCRDFVDDVVLPFIKQNWRQEWSMTPEGRLPASILDGAPAAQFLLSLKELLENPVRILV